MLLKHNIKIIFGNVLLALLGFVITFNLVFNAFHIQTEAHHDATEQKCLPDDENDTCHRFLIHNEESSACNGTHQHITKKIEECFVCKHFKNHQPFVKTNLVINFITHNTIKYYVLKETKLKFPYSSFVFLRGPPIIG